MSRPVPNEAPASDPGALRLALVGESPGADECALGRPFAGKSGWLLNQWLAQAGVSRSQVFVGNVVQVRPSVSSNDFHLFEWNEQRVQEGIAALREDLARFRPNCVVALGNAALHLLRHGNVAPPKSAKLRLFQWASHIGTWRGSLFLASSSFDPLASTMLRESERTRYENLEVQPQSYGVPACVIRNDGMPLESKPFLGGKGEYPVKPSNPVAGSTSFLSADCGATLTDALAQTSPCPGSAAPLSGSPHGGPEAASERDGSPLLTLAHPLGNSTAGTPSSFQGPLPAAATFVAGNSVQDPLEGVGRATDSACIPPPLLPATPFYKTLATYHPAATFRDPSFAFPLVSDLKRAVAEARSPILSLPVRDIRLNLSIDEIEAACAHIRALKHTVAHDIEGGLGGLQCASFALTPHSAFVVDLMERSWDYPRRVAAVASVLEDPEVPKVLWNAAYERAIWQAVASVTLRNYHDGMLAWWERFSELPKGLDYVASILTREPYWAEGIGWDRKTGLPKVTGPRFLTYNGLDSCITLEIWQHPLIRAVTEARAPVPFALQP